MVLLFHASKKKKTQDVHFLFILAAEIHQMMVKAFVSLLDLHNFFSGLCAKQYRQCMQIKALSATVIYS